VIISGSADGLGLQAAQELIAGGHEVVLHARSEPRGREALGAAPGARGVVIGDLASIEATRELARQANQMGPYDAVIHNAGVGYRSPGRVETVDGLSQLFAVNVLAPYLLTALIEPPGRLIYLSSGMHQMGNPGLEDLQWQGRPWDGPQAYADSKLLDVVLAFAVARHWPRVLSNAVEPGWVATKMGGPDAPGDLSQGAATQVWLATSQAPEATVSGRCFHHLRPQATHPATADHCLQDDLLRRCAELSATRLPSAAAPARAVRPEPVLGEG
jgi:NAD(P)-dependent dehydrogenase (short-subunit alcohol dehydrogenase family)